MNHQAAIRNISQARRIQDAERISDANSQAQRGTKLRDYSDGVVVRVNGSEEYCVNYGGAIANGSVVLVSKTESGSIVTGTMGTNG
jgi:hypothetical protein